MTIKSRRKKLVIKPEGNALFHLAFTKTAQPNMISIVSNGKIVIVNRAACKLLGYSKKELLTKNRAEIFDFKEQSFVKMLKERTAEGQSITTVKAIRKTGTFIPCQITAAVFADKDNIKKSIISITDLSEGIRKQEVIDTKKEKAIAKNIVIAKSAQNKIDITNRRVVAHNILVAKSKQKKTAEKKQNIVTRNIAAALSKQKFIDIKNEKIVTESINTARAEAEALVIANNKWIKHIAKTSYDVMWDWDILSGKVYVGDSIKEIFGYALKNNSVDSSEIRQKMLQGLDCAVITRLEETLVSKSNSWTDAFTVKKVDGSIAFVNSRATIVRDPDGKAIRMIGAMQDVSKLRDLQILVRTQAGHEQEKDDMFQLAAKLSYDGLWDWNLLTGDFFLGEGFEKLFGFEFTKESNTLLDWSNFLHPNDKEAVEKGLENAIKSSASNWEHAYRFMRTDGKIINVFGRASIIRDEEGKAIRLIGVIHDLSRQKELEENLEQQKAAAKELVEQNENFRMMINSSSDVLYDIDLATDEITLSDGYEKEFGHKRFPNMKVSDVWGKNLHPDDRGALLSDYYRMLASEETVWKYTYRLLRKNGSIANVLSRRVILRKADGTPYRMIGSMQDISKQKVLEEKLKEAINLKEKQIAEATESERSSLGRELHDNVNQLLSVSRLYLEMAKQGGPQSELHLNRSSEYTLNAIEEIRKLTKGLTTPGMSNMGLCDSIENLAMVTMEVNPVNITCALDRLIEDRVNEKFKVNILRIIQEQLNNILKHAQAKQVSILLTRNSESITLTISDNGVGFDTTKKRKGIGIDNIKSRAEAYNGKVELTSQPQKGCILTVSFEVLTY